MSVLDKISVLEDALKSILILLEENKEKLDRLLASGKAEVWVEPPKRETRIHSPGFEDYEPEPKKALNTTEEVEQDFSKVTVMNQTDKALLVVKNGYQQWLARQFIKDKLKEYDNGVLYDIELKEKSNAGKPISWILKKWVPFEVFKS